MTFQVEGYQQPEVVQRYLSLVVKNATSWGGKDAPTQEDFTKIAHEMVEKAPEDPTTISWAVPYLAKWDPPKT